MEVTAAPIWINCRIRPAITLTECRSMRFISQEAAKNRTLTSRNGEPGGVGSMSSILICRFILVLSCQVDLVTLNFIRVSTELLVSNRKQLVFIIVFAEI